MFFSLVELIQCMSKSKKSLSLTAGLYLCKQLIAKTKIQQKLSIIMYAEIVEDLGKVGRHY